MKKDIVNISIRQIVITAVILSSCLSLMAQNESDSIHISTDFLKELDNTFGFKNERPKIANINTIEAIKPDSELLHQWVKDPNAHRKRICSIRS